MSEVEDAHSQGSSEMSGPTSRKLRELFLEAAEIEDAMARAAFLDRACGEDTDLRRRLNELLTADQAAGPVPLQPATPEPRPGEGVGSVIGRYKLLQQIGEGGCGVVYMAEQVEPVRRQVALKIIKLGMDTRSVIARFQAERQALAMMEHPNIAKVHDAGATETGRPYFVMELVRGIKITDYCDQHNLSTRQRLDLFIQVCDAVQHAHQKGVIHRDLKPSNILVTQRDGVPVPKVIDFGIAKAITEQRLTDKTLFTAFEQFLGTPAYMSPEQAELSELGTDTRSDIYSLGVLLYELLTGSTPFDTQELLKSGIEEMRRTIREKDPPTPSSRLIQARLASNSAPTGHSALRTPLSAIDRDLDWIVMKCLEKDRSRRYATANGLAMDIERHLNNEPVVASPPTKLYRLEKLVRRNRGAFSALASILALLILGVGGSTWEAVQARRAEKEQVQLRQEARTAAAKSHQVAQFLRDMLAGVGPSRARGRDATMLREILDKTAERVRKELTNQPGVAYELLTTLGETYRDLGLYKQMDDTAKESLRLARAGLGAQHPSVAFALWQVASAERLLGNYEQAEILNREALAMRRKLLGNDHLEVARSLNGLGLVLTDRGKFAEAETVYREALAILRKRLPQDDLEPANVINNLAMALRAEGKLAEAEAAHRDALAMRRKLLGSEHPDVANSLNNLSTVLRDQARPAEAEQSAREALAIRRKLLGDDHPFVANTLSGLGSALVDQGKVEAAEAAFRQALEIRRQRLGQEHPLVAESLGNLGVALRYEGKLGEAEAMHREALAMFRRLLGDQHPDVRNALTLLAIALREDDKLAEAEGLLREVVALHRKVLGDGHPHLALSLAELATTLLEQARFAEAEPLAREALTILEKGLPDDWRTFSTRRILGSSLLGQNKYAEAEPLLSSGYEGMKQREPKMVPMESKARLKKALRDLVRLYEATDRPEEAASWRKKLEEFEQDWANGSTCDWAST
jgi:serine/threonine protein kinase/tetratricopeptide (TPR) repeat protein